MLHLLRLSPHQATQFSEAETSLATLETSETETTDEEEPCCITACELGCARLMIQYFMKIKF